jgi:C1A family cysteine protease
MALVDKKPLSVHFIANNQFNQYSSGIFNCSANYTDSEINHAVQVVGYNTTGNYYIIKNSWGTQWGMNGFAYVNMDSDCAIKREVWIS